MNIKSKHFNSIVAGCTSSVAVNGDLNFALRQWKKNLKDNKIVESLYDRKFFVKQSDKKRKLHETAKYYQLQESKNDKL